MKITSSALPPFPRKRLNEDVIQAVKEPLTDARQALKESAQQQIAQMEAARNDVGEDDPKAQFLIDKFKNGKKLTAEEMAYVRKNAPGMVDYIDRIMREREVIELSMKAAPSKMDVQVVAYRASKQLHQYRGEDAEVRAKHVADAKHEYEQTDDYKEKPNSPLQQRQKETIRTYKSEQEVFVRAVSAYSKQLQHVTKQ